MCGPISRTSDELLFKSKNWPKISECYCCVVDAGGFADFSAFSSHPAAAQRSPGKEFTRSEVSLFALGRSDLVNANLFGVAFNQTAE